MTVTKNTSVTVAKGDLDRPAGVARYLAPVVHDLIALAVNAKQAHWHVRGENFIGVHEFLDEVVEHAHGGADEVAERIVALGLPIDARVGSVAAQTSTPELSAGFQPSSVTVSEIVAQLDATLATVYAAVEGLDDIDLPSQDIAIAIAQQLDKDRWFLYSHFAD
ncbi:MAG: DNA starvation/stationary phase protection protein [Leucobacter sp.]|nr:DNA starvation/stationary phase protection protein [Leucobacter sp.]